VESGASARIAARVRFEDPTKFLEFYEKQLRNQIVGLRHPEAIPEGTPFQVLVSPPQAPDSLRLDGRATRVTPRPDGSVRVRVQVELTEADRLWLDAYLTGLRAARAVPEDTAPGGPYESTDLPPRPTPEPLDREEAAGLLARIDGLTYYQLLGVPADADLPMLQRRFHELTRRFHPDLYYALPDGELRNAVHRIYRRMNEAYGVLRDPRRRRLYERGLQGPPHTWRLRLSEEDEQAAQRQARTRRGSTGAGHYYWTMARDVLERARQLDTGIRPALRESARLLRVALVFEPENEHFRHALEHVTDRLAMPEDD
jgi:hypothetical protein